MQETTNSVPLEYSWDQYEILFKEFITIARKLGYEQFEYRMTHDGICVFPKDFEDCQRVERFGEDVHIYALELVAKKKQLTLTASLQSDGETERPYLLCDLKFINGTIMPGIDLYKSTCMMMEVLNITGGHLLEYVPVIEEKFKKATEAIMR